MANSFIAYTGQTGAVTDYAIPFGFIKRLDVTAEVDDVSASFTWLSDSLIRMDTAPVGDLLITRDTDTTSRVVTFVDGSTHSADKHNLQNDQLLYVTQEAFDSLGDIMSSDGISWDAEGRRIQSVGDPVNDQDAVTKLWAETSMDSSVGNAIAAQTAAEVAQAAAEAAAADAAASALSVGTVLIADVDTLLVSDLSIYTVGQAVRVVADGFFYELAASAAVDHHVTTSFGDKLYVKPIGGMAFNPRQFGGNWDGILDDTTILDICHTTANTSGLPVVYFGIDTFLVDHEANIQISTTTDFGGALGSVKDGIVGGSPPDIANRTVVFHVYDTDTPLVEGTATVDGINNLKIGSLTPTIDFFEGPGVVNIKVSDHVGNAGAQRIPSRDKLTSEPFTITFEVNENGVVAHPLPIDLSTVVEVDYRYRETKQKPVLELRGINVDVASFDNLAFIHVERNNVSIRDLVALPATGETLPDSQARVVEADDCAHLHYENFIATALQEPTSGTNFINFWRCANIHVNNITALDGWGQMGGNHNTNYVFSNSIINRFDVHGGAHNIRIENVTVQDIGIQYGWGTGYFKVHNTKSINCPILQTRHTSYGGYFWGVISVENCEAHYDSFDALLVDIQVGHQIPAATETLEIPCPSILIHNVTRIGNDKQQGSNGRVTALQLKVDVLAEQGPIAPQTVVIDGIYGTHNWKFSTILDHRNMEKGDADDFLVRIANIGATTACTSADDGLNVRATTLTIAGPVKPLFRFENWRYMAADTRGAGGVIHEVSNCLINGFLTEDSVQTTIYNSEFKDPLDLGVLGGTSGSGNNNLVIVGGRSEGAFDFSDVTACSGLYVSDSAATYPATISRGDMFNGFRL